MRARWATLASGIRRRPIGCSMRLRGGVRSASTLCQRPKLRTPASVHAGCSPPSNRLTSPLMFRPAPVRRAALRPMADSAGGAHEPPDAVGCVGSDGRRDRVRNAAACRRGIVSRHRRVWPFRLVPSIGLGSGHRWDCRAGCWCGSRARLPDLLRIDSSTAAPDHAAGLQSHRGGRGAGGYRASPAVAGHALLPQGTHGADHRDSAVTPVFHRREHGLNQPPYLRAGSAPPISNVVCSAMYA